MCWLTSTDSLELPLNISPNFAQSLTIGARKCPSWEYGSRVVEPACRKELTVQEFCEPVLQKDSLLKMKLHKLINK